MQGVSFYEWSAHQRLSDEALNKCLEKKPNGYYEAPNCTVQLPSYVELVKAGIYAPAPPGYDEDHTFLLAALRSLYIVLCQPAPKSVAVHARYDANVISLPVKVWSEIVKDYETIEWYPIMDYKAMVHLLEPAVPIAYVRDKARRKQYCQDMLVPRGGARPERQLDADGDRRHLCPGDDDGAVAPRDGRRPSAPREHDVVERGARLQEASGRVKLVRRLVDEARVPCGGLQVVGGHRRVQVLGGRVHGRRQSPPRGAQGQVPRGPELEPKEVKPRAEPRRRARRAGQGRVERGDRWAAYLNLEPSTWPLSYVSRSLIQMWVGGCRERVPVHSSCVVRSLE